MSEVLCVCPGCAAKFKVDSKYAGKKARCPKCSVIVEVPSAGNAPPSAPSTATANPPSSSTTTVVPSITTQAPPKAGMSSTNVPKPAPVAKPLPPRPAAPVAPAPQEQAMDATVEEDLPANVWDAPGTSNPTSPASESPAPSSSSSSGFDFQIKTKKSKPPAPTSGSSAAIDTGTSTEAPAVPLFNTAVSSAPAAAHDPNQPAHKPRGKKESKSALPLIIGGVALLLLVMIGGGVALLMNFNSGQPAVAKNNGKGKNPGATAAASAMGKLVLDMSEEDRKNGFAVKIDGRTQPALSKGELTYDLKPGDRKLELQRRGGYEPVDAMVAIKAGETTTFKPDWKKTEFTVGAPSLKPVLPGNTNNTSSSGPDFSVGIGAGTPVKGFDGFTQNFQLAKENALKQNKNILVIFARSDTDQQSFALARATQEEATKTEIMASFIPVVLDFPQTRDAHDNVYDVPGNAALAKEFQVRQTPALALLDSKGKSYYLQTEWKQGGTSALKTYLAEGAAARTERDALWAEVKGESLDPAVKFVTWLMDKKLIFRYGPEVKQWLATARRLDGANDNGQLEHFIEAEMASGVTDVKPGDRLDAQQFVSPLQEFLTTKKFKDDDRGARLHLLAAMLLGRSEQTEEATKHLARAATYNPKDKKLKDAVASAKSLIERGRILSTGTGFVVSEAGYIMTNHHVIEGRGKVIVRLPDNKTTVEGTVIAEDEDRDMAIVKVTFPAGMTVKTVPVAPVNVGRGMDVAAFGYPLAEGADTAITLTTGRVGKLPDDSTDQMITLDLRVNPGNSGGPLCDNKGNVVGMVTAKTRTNTFTNEDSYGMAIPSPDLVKFLDAKLPPGTPRPQPTAGTQRLEWGDVDALVSPGVLLILKME